MLNGMAGIETTEFLLSRIDDFGTPDAYNHYAVGWAHALCTPYQWTKQIASHWGGTRNGTIVHWPNGITARGETRSQFHHVIDVAKTILEAAGLPEPAVVNSIARRRWRASACWPPSRRQCARDPHVAVLRDVRQPRHLPQGLDSGDQAPHAVDADRRRRSTTMCGSSTAPTTGPRHTTSPSENPQKLAEMQRLWLIEAVKYNVVPLDDRGFERINPDIAGRPQLIPGTASCCSPGCGSARTAC